MISDYTACVKTRDPILRRLTACVLALSFGLYTAESLFADTHDGDATHEELARVDGASEHAAFHLAHGDEVKESQLGAREDSPENHPGERAPGEPGHDQHACHCAHVHSGWMQSPPQCEAELAVNSGQPMQFCEQTPASRQGEPQLRPPIG